MELAIFSHQADRSENPIEPVYLRTLSHDNLPCIVNQPSMETEDRQILASCMTSVGVITGSRQLFNTAANTAFFFCSTEEERRD